MEFDLENPLEYFHDLPNSQDVSSLFLIESDHIPPLNYFQNLKSNEFDASVRSDFISLISQVINLFLSKTLFDFVLVRPKSPSIQTFRSVCLDLR